MNISEDILRPVFDIAVESFEFAEFSFEDSEVIALREMATLLNVDPMIATPKTHRSKFCPGHQWRDMTPIEKQVSTRHGRICDICNTVGSGLL